MMSLLLWLHLAHMDEFPMMAVGVIDPVQIHEAVICGCGFFRAASLHGLRDEFIDLGAALAAQAERDLGGFRGVAYGLRRERAPLLMRERHVVNLLADDDARRSIAGELRVVGEAKCFPECQRARHVGDGKVDVDLPIHGYVFLVMVWRQS